MGINSIYIENYIKSYMAIPENNNMKELAGVAFGEPIVGFSRGSDALYDFYRVISIPIFTVLLRNGSKPLIQKVMLHSIAMQQATLSFR